jgi:hypothetical protein
MTDNLVIIAGGGIGGLATALTLHQIGVPSIVFEAVPEMRPLGVGINLQPNAVRELYDLGIAEKDLDRVGMPAREWALVGLNWLKRRTPQSEPESAPGVAQCEGSPLERAAQALNSLQETWEQAAATAPHGAGCSPVVGDPRALAFEFRRALLSQRDLLGWGIPSNWVRAAYPISCQAQGIEWAPPYKDFAPELGKLMPRKRDFSRPRTCTRYHEVEKASTVVKLVEARRG